MKGNGARFFGVVAGMVVAAVMGMGCADWGAKPNVPALQEAQRLKLAGQNVEAIATAQRYLTDNPKSKERSDALLLIGQCEMATGQYAQAQRDFQEAQMKPRTNAITAQGRFGMGEAAFAQDNYGDAVRGYESALKTGKGDIPAAKAVYKLGLAQIRNGNWEEGRRRMREVKDSYGSTEQAELAKDVLSMSNDAFQLQCGSFHNQTGAENVMRLLRAQGLTPTVQTVTRSGEPRYNVRVGNYNTYAEARAACDRVKAKKIEAFVIP